MQVFKTTLMGGVILKDYVSSLKIESRFLLKARMQLTYKVNSEENKERQKRFLIAVFGIKKCVKLKHDHGN